MTILFEDDLTTVIHGQWQDHLDLVRGADVLITDPPYGMRYVSNSSKLGPTAPIRGDASTRERDDLLDEWFGVNAPRLDRPALVFGTWRMPHPTWEVRELIIWHKRGGGMGDLRIPWSPTHEEIYVMGGHREGDWTGRRESNVIITGKRTGNATNSHNEHGHPTPKPIAVMHELIKHTTGETIIDPFAGSGSTGVAARLMRRKSIMIEMELPYAEAMAARIRRITHEEAS